MKYGKHIVEKICALIESDDFTIKEVCKQVGISHDTYCTWKNEKAEFSEALKKADDKRLEKFKAAARSGLLTLLNGKQFEEVTSEYAYVLPEGKKRYSKVLKNEKVVKKFILPNPTSVIFALKNLDPDNFRDIVEQKLQGPNGEPLDLSGNFIINLL